MLRRIEQLLFKLAVSLLLAVLLRMHIDAGGAQGEQAVWAPAEVEDGLLGVEGALLRLVD